MCPSTAMQKTFNLKQHLTQNYAKGNLKMFCHISFMLRCHNKKEEFPVSTAVLLFQRLNKNHQGIAVIDEAIYVKYSSFWPCGKRLSSDSRKTVTEIVRFRYRYW